MRRTGGPRDVTRRRRGDGRRFFPRRKVCGFCVDHVATIDYKDVPRLRRYISDEAKIEPRRRTGTCAPHQRALALAIKRARIIALLPFTGGQGLFALGRPESPRFDRPRGDRRDRPGPPPPRAPVTATAEPEAAPQATAGPEPEATAEATPAGVESEAPVEEAPQESAVVASLPAEEPPPTEEPPPAEEPAAPESGPSDEDSSGEDASSEKSQPTSS